MVFFLIYNITVNFWENRQLVMTSKSKFRVARETTNLAIAKQRSEGVWRNSLGTHGKRMGCLKYGVHAETLREIGTHARKKKIIQEYILQDFT